MYMYVCVCKYVLFACTLVSVSLCEPDMLKVPRVGGPLIQIYFAGSCKTETRLRERTCRLGGTG